MKYLVLGPLKVENGGRRSLGGRKERAVLAQLIAQGNTAVRASRIAYGLWGDTPPATAGRTLQAYVTRLRRALGPDGDGSPVLVTEPEGWLLRVDPADVDASVFESMVGDARHMLADGRATQARELLARALALWRGEAYAGFDDLPACQAEAVRLAELRRLAEDEWLAALLHSGQAAEVVAHAQALLREEPLRETRWALLIRAQCAVGRSADALDTYARAQAALREELGVDPGPELRYLQRAILSRDPVLISDDAPAGVMSALLARPGPPLIGRDAELDRLVTLWIAARSGAGGVVVVAGVAGVGKSRLVAELAARVAGEGATVQHAGGDGTLAIDGPRTPRLVVVDDLRPVDVPHLVDQAGRLRGEPALVVAVVRDVGDALADSAGRCVADVTVVRLGPLTGDDVATIVRSYELDGIHIDVERVVAAANGIPLRAHTLASAAVSRAAARRVYLAAHRAERSRRGLTDGYDDLTDAIMLAERIRRTAALHLPRDRPAHQARIPYRGLAAFDADDADVFFGRERLVAELVARLATGRFLAVVGPSGGGKSSLVRAGLVPALRSGALPGSTDWRVQVVTPAAGPPEFADAAPGLLVVDQFEELFIAGSVQRADEFLDALDRVAASGRVVVTLRSDFYADATSIPALGQRLESGTAFVGPMRLDDLRRAIVEPALAAGLDITDDLVDTVLQDVAGQPGALPLLSVALLETYRRRAGGVLRLDAYQAAGGVNGALARLAEEAYGGLDPAHRPAVRRVLLRLAEEDHGRLVRRRARLSEVAPAGDADALAAVEALARHRLLVVAEGTVEVAHEALLAAWPRCQEWLAADAVGRRVRAGLSAAAAAWHASGRQDSDLYRGVRLVAAVDWAADQPDQVTPLERDFLTGSDEAAERERLAAEARATYRARQARRLRFSLSAVAALLAVSLVAGLLAVRAAQVSRAEADAATAARLGALALTEQRVDTAALLAVQAIAVHSSPETRADLLSTLLRWPQVRRVTVPTGTRLLGLDVSPDAHEIAVTDNRGRVARVDVASWRPHGPVLDTRTWRAFAVAFSPDGNLLATTGQVGATAEDLVLSVWDAATGVELQRTQSVSAAGFLWAPPGSPIAGVSASTDGIASWTGRAGHWTQHLHRTTTWAIPVAFAANRNSVLVVEQTGWATWYDPVTWSPNGPRIPVSTHEVWAAQDREQRILAVGDDDGTVRLLNPATGRPRVTLTGQHGAIETLKFDPSGQRLVSTADDGTAIVWDVATGERLWSYSGLGGAAAVSAQFAPGGPSPSERLYLAAHDGTLLDVSLTGALLGRQVATAAGQDLAVWPVGRQPVSGGGSGTLNSVNLGAEPQDASWPDTVLADHGIESMATVPGTGSVVVGGQSGEVALVGPVGQVTRTFRKPSTRLEDQVTSVAAAGDGRLIFAATADRHLYAYDGTTGTMLWGTRFGDQDDPFMRGANLAFDPRRDRLAVGLGDHTAAIVDPATGRTVHSFRVTDDLIPPSVAFDPGTGALITGLNDGTLGFWDPNTGRSLVQPVPGPPAYPRVLQVSDVGNRAATVGHDGSVALWDTAAHSLLGRLPTHGAGASAIAIAPDGKRLLVIEPDGTATVWDLDEDSWIHAACALAGRQLTRSEWQRFLPEQPYQPACQPR